MELKKVQEKNLELISLFLPLCYEKCVGTLFRTLSRRPYLPIHPRICFNQSLPSLSQHFPFSLISIIVLFQKSSHVSPNSFPGTCVEAFGSGTAAVVAPVAKFHYKGKVCRSFY